MQAFPGPVTAHDERLSPKAHSGIASAGPHPCLDPKKPPFETTVENVRRRTFLRVPGPGREF